MEKEDFLHEDNQGESPISTDKEEVLAEREDETCPADASCDQAESVESNDATNETDEAEDSEEGILTQILSEIASLSEHIVALGKLFNSKILHSEHERKVVDQMHQELQKYKNDMYSQLIRPVLLDVIEMRNSLITQAKVYRSKPDGEQDIPLKLFESYTFNTDEILEKNSIIIFRSEPKTEFIPVRQRPSKKISTDDQSLHGKIESSLCDGYEYLGKVIFPEKVAVYTFEATQPQTTNKEDEQNG